MKDLEHIVAARLFDRTTRTVALTKAGSTLLSRAHELFDQLDKSVSETQLAARGETGRLAIGVAGGAAENRLPRVFATFRRRFPSISLEVRLLGSGPQIEAVARGEIDVGFAISPSPSAALSTEILCRTGFLLQVPQLMKSGPGARQKLSYFRECEFIALTTSTSPGYAARCQALFSEAGFTPNLVHYADDPQTIMTLVSAGAGVSIVPALMQGIRRAGVKHIPLQSKISVELAMIYRRGDQRTSLNSLREIATNVFEASAG